MKRMAIIITALCLSACTTNGEIDYGKTATLIGVVALGAALAAQNSDSSGSNCSWAVTSSGSTQYCR